jgi:uncharacterized protein YacL
VATHGDDDIGEMLSVGDATIAGHHGDPGDGDVAASQDEPARIPSDVFVEVVRVLLVAMATAGGSALGDGIGAALGACVGYVAGGVLGRTLKRASGAFEARVELTPAATLVAGAVGAMAAAMIGAVVGIAAVFVLPGRWGYPVLGITIWTGVYAGFQVGARKGMELVDQLDRVERLATPAAGPTNVLVDSSAAVDGRLLELAKSGFLPGPLAVPRFVLDELQGLSGSADATRRRRARRGLELLEAVRNEGPGLVVLPDEVPEQDEVDAKLVALARRSGAAILTADRGLLGVAGAEGVRCLDVTRLADGLRPDLVPGETVHLRITREGRDPGQGVGYLSDGTMIVIADVGDRLGHEVDVEITSSVPTSKGRLYFATLSG